MKVNLKFLKRFWKKVCIKSANECWEWTGTLRGRKNHKYGYFYSFKISAHRFSYLIHFGTIPEGQEACHSCDNCKCVNPNHLWTGTHHENMLDAKSKDRMSKAWLGRKHTLEELAKMRKALLGSNNPMFGIINENHPSSKISDTQRIEIKNKFAAGKSVKSIVKEYPLKKSQIYNILNKNIYC